MTIDSDSSTSSTTKEPRLYVRKPTGRMIPCPGEAHGNAYIDNCMTCAPGWGTLPELEPVDIELARKQRLDIRVVDLDEHEEAIMHEYRKRGEVTLVSIRRRRRHGHTSFMVWRWT